MEQFVSLGFETTTKKVGVEGCRIPFNSKKGMTRGPGLARETIRGYLEHLLGPNFDGRISVNPGDEQTRNMVQSLRIQVLPDSSGQIEVQVEASNEPVDNSEFLDENGIFFELSSGIERNHLIIDGNEIGAPPVNAENF